MKQFIITAPIILLLLFCTACPWDTPPSPTRTPTPAPTPYGDADTLLITEVGDCVYIDVSSWVEVYNYGTQAVNISGWELRSPGRLENSPYTAYSDRTFTIPSFTIPAGSYAMIRGKSDSHLADGEQVIHVIDGSNIVPNWCGEGGFVELIKDGESIDFVRFGSSTVAPTEIGAWTSGAAPSMPYSNPSYYGYSIARDVYNTDTNDPSDWTLRAFSTQGGQNDVTSDTDADQDGIPDCSESPGTTFAGLPLYDWGARLDQRDIFIQIDYMDSVDEGINPRKEALDNMRLAFLNSPAGPFYVHFDIGDLYDSAYGTDPSDYDLSDTSHQVPYAQAIQFNPENSNFANFYEYKYTYMDLARKQVFHYVLFANSQNADGSGGSSGIAEVPGNDVMVTLGNWNLHSGTLDEENKLINFQAGTLMHEFGHNLGLWHGGDETTNYKPNYVSIMNYMYQLYGLPAITIKAGDRYYWNEYLCDGELSDFKNYFPEGMASLEKSPYTTDFDLDYSDGTSSSLNEEDLNENLGLRRSGSTGVDWNGDSDTTDINLERDINRDTYTNTGVLTDYNDWANINLLFIRDWNGDEEGVGPDGLRTASVSGPVGDEMERIHVETLYPPEEPGK